MALVPVFNGHTWFEIFDFHITQHFPRLWFNFDQDGGCINLCSLADQIHATLPACSRKSVLGILKSLFGLLTSPNIQHEGISFYVGNRLHSLFSDDTHVFGHPKGLQRSRNYFTVLAAFAQMSDGEQVAMTLVDVFWRQRRNVLDYERTGKLFEWAMALESLRGLAPDHDINRCLQYLARKHDSLRDHYDNSGLYSPSMEAILAQLLALLGSGRGRNFRRGGWGLPAPRARTVPARYYRPRHLTLPAPDPLALGYPSPAHSMNHLDDRDFEMDVIKMEQEVMRERIENLEANQELDMGFGGPIPPLRTIGWT